MIGDWAGLSNHVKLGGLMQKGLTLRSGMCPMQARRWPRGGRLPGGGAAGVCRGQAAKQCWLFWSPLTLSTCTAALLEEAAAPHRGESAPARAQLRLRAFQRLQGGCHRLLLTACPGLPRRRASWTPRLWSPTSFRWSRRAAGGGWAPRSLLPLLQSVSSTVPARPTARLPRCHPAP